MTSSSQPSLLSETLEKYKKTIERRHKYVKNEFQDKFSLCTEGEKKWIFTKKKTQISPKIA